VTPVPLGYAHAWGYLVIRCVAETAGQPKIPPKIILRASNFPIDSTVKNRHRKNFTIKICHANDSLIIFLYVHNTCTL
jgi:hypothetical protein